MSASTNKRCSRCKTTKDVSNFGHKKNGDEYKTCLKCRCKNNTTTIDNTIPLKNHKCLVTCYDPYRCIHDSKCTNFGSSCINLKYKPFLNHLDIVQTISSEYGYSVRPLPTITPSTIEEVQDCYSNLELIDLAVKHTKTMCVVKYDKHHNFMKDIFIGTLDPQTQHDANKHNPCVIVKFRHQTNIHTLVLRNCNSFKHFFTHHKIQHMRKCNICLENSKKFMSCYRCPKRCCETCVKKFESLTCPFCNYDILQHHCNMCNLYDICD